MRVPPSLTATMTTVFPGKAKENLYRDRDKKLTEPSKIHCKRKVYVKLLMKSFPYVLSSKTIVILKTVGE